MNRLSLGALDMVAFGPFVAQCSSPVFSGTCNVDKNRAPAGARFNKIICKLNYQAFTQWIAVPTLGLTVRDIAMGCSKLVMFFTVRNQFVCNLDSRIPCFRVARHNINENY